MVVVFSVGRELTFQGCFRPAFFSFIFLNDEKLLWGKYYFFATILRESTFRGKTYILYNA
jgi:hypothetical protein